MLLRVIYDGRVPEGEKVDKIEVGVGKTAQEVRNLVMEAVSGVDSVVLVRGGVVLGGEDVVEEESFVVAGFGDLVEDLPSATGYEGFGSFFSGNLEDMVRVKEEDWKCPRLPEEVEAEVGSLSEYLVDFGGVMRKKGFGLEEKWCFVNHGAFGGAHVYASRVAEAWRKRVERQPLRFFDRELFPFLCESLRVAARLVDAGGPTEVALVPNATTGLNVAVNAANIGSGDVTYCLDIGYGGVKKMLEDACKETGASVVYGAVDLEELSQKTSAEECNAYILEVVAKTMPDDCKFAVFDVITSNTALLLPYIELSRLAKESKRCKFVLVDGAHALGSVPIRNDASIDWFVTNVHKWYASPRGLGILRVAPHVRDHTRPLVRSHGVESGFVSAFSWDGCRDYAPSLALPHLYAFWSKLSMDAVESYCRNLQLEAVNLLKSQWNATTLVPLTLCPRMCLVRLPLQLAPKIHARYFPDTPFATANSTHAKWIQDTLYHIYSVECPVKCVAGKLWVRISVYVYNTIQDYQTLATTILKILARL